MTALEFRNASSISCRMATCSRLIDHHALGYRSILFRVEPRAHTHSELTAIGRKAVPHRLGSAGQAVRLLIRGRSGQPPHTEEFVTWRTPLLAPVVREGITSGFKTANGRH